jgi:DNA primase catalytic core
MSIFEHVKEQVNIVDVVERDEALKKEASGELSGAHVVAHESKGGRCLFVNEAKQVYHCYHCGEGGDVFDYVAQKNNSTKFEALEWLCDTYGIQRPDWTPEQKAKFEKQQRERVDVRALIKECFQFYHDTMTDQHRAYYHKRGLTDKTIDTEMCGYAEKGNLLFAHMLKKYGQSIVGSLLQTGLFFKFDSGIRDRYQDRYVIPYWYKGDIVFSIGRSTDPNIEAHKKYVKHLTHSDKYPYVSEVAVKHIIYGEDTVFGAKEVIITEGIIDSLLAKQTGYVVISPITTKFSDKDNERLAELCKHAETVYILNDNETNRAGETGALKTARVLSKAKVNVRIGTIPRPEGVGKVDLADFIVGHGDKAKEAVDKLLAEAVDILTFELQQTPADIDKLELVGKIKEILQEAVEAGNSVEWLRAWLKTKVKERFDLTTDDVRNYQSLLNRLHRDHTDTQRQEQREQRRETRQQELNDLKDQDEAEYLRALIHDIRIQPVRIFEIKQSVSKIVVDDMKARGKFYKTRTEQYYYFNNETKQLVEIGDRTFEHYTNYRYQLNSTEKEYEYLVADLEAEAGLRGEKKEVYRFAYYDTDTHTLYVDRNDNQFLRLNGDTIDLLANGSEGVLFISDISHEPFQIVDIADKKFIEPLIIEPTNFIQGEHVNLNKTEQEILLNVWLHTLFFEELQPTKPILTFIGEKGSGKTTRQKTIGKWLIGKNFNVQGINEEDDFLATITGNYLASFDNVDCYKKWLNDRLAQVATGQRIERRKLYTTNELARYYPRCFVTLNSREPKFRRDDVVDRLLLFKVERLEHFRSEARILKEIADNRDYLWSELLHNLNMIVKALREDTAEPFTSNYRMADFAELGWRIAKADNAGDLWLSLLGKMQKERSEFLLFEDPIYQVIHTIILSTGHTIEDMTTSQLYSVFKEYAEKDNIAFTDSVKSAMSLGKRLGHLLHDLQEYFDITRRQDLKIGFRYTITKKTE